MVAFVHDECQVIQFGKHPDEGIPEHLVFPAHGGGFFVKFIDVIDKYADIAGKETELFAFIILICDDFRSADKAAQSPEDIFGIVGIGKLALEFFKDGGVGSHDEEVSEVMPGVKQRDEGAHQTGFPNTGRQGESEGDELALKVGAGGIQEIDRRQRGADVPPFAQCDVFKDLF